MQTKIAEWPVPSNTISMQEIYMLGGRFFTNLG